MDQRACYSKNFQHTRRGITDDAGLSLRGGAIAGALVALGVLIGAVALLT